MKYSGGRESSLTLASVDQVAGAEFWSQHSPRAWPSALGHLGFILASSVQQASAAMASRPAFDEDLLVPRKLVWSAVAI